MDAVKLLVVFVAIVIALRKRVPVGLTLLGAGLLTLVLFQTPPDKSLTGYLNLVKSTRFISLTAVVVLITVLGSLLKELKYLGRLADACKSLYGGNRTAVAVLPGLVGLMPMPGGSLLSAPLVDNVLAAGKYPPEFKVVSNYWFRHHVEFFWPVYPGLILTEATTGMPIGSVSLVQLPLAAAMFLIGLIFFVRRIDASGNRCGSLLSAAAGIARTIWPIVLAIVVYGVLRVELSLAVLVSLLLLVIVARPKGRLLLRALRDGFSVNLILLVFGVLSFQTALEISGAISAVTRLTTSAGLPPEAVIFAVCGTIGLLTGMVSAYVGLGYSLLAGLLYQPEIAPAHIMLAYLSGYLGVMLSPSHLCLILTNEFFKSDLARVYRLMVPPFLLLALIGFLIYLSPWPQLFR